MQLCDKEIYAEIIKGELILVGPNTEFPFIKENQIQPASIDLRLGNKIMRFRKEIENFDTKNILHANDLYDVEQVENGNPIMIEPHQTIFGEIYERICIPNYLSARIRGRNRISRLGISVHCTGDYINPGFIGDMPLQISNHNDFPVILYPYTSICQMVLYRLSDTPLVSYRERLQLALDPYFNGTVPLQKVKKTEKEYAENIVAYRIYKIVKEYYDSLKDGLSARQKSSIIKEVAKENYNAVMSNKGNKQKNNMAISNVSGIQVINTGDHSTLQVDNFKMANSNFDIPELLKELEKIKGYLHSNFEDDEHVIMDGQVRKAEKALKENHPDKAMEFLKEAGRKLQGIAKEIGCNAVASCIAKLMDV